MSAVPITSTRLSGKQQLAPELLPALSIFVELVMIWDNLWKYQCLTQREWPPDKSFMKGEMAHVSQSEKLVQLLI